MEIKTPTISLRCNTYLETEAQASVFACEFFIILLYIRCLKWSGLIYHGSDYAVSEYSISGW